MTSFQTNTSQSCPNFDFCILRGQCDRVFQELLEFSRPRSFEGPSQNLLSDAEPAECGEQIGAGWFSF